ncbi:glycine-rich RNA-binding protein GRP2A [Brachypodium distachyon]|uniref:RRM domain-containing protein n=1 Tax=Brachypodium distachyon TaxID=15368 RepID=I1H8K8_BRADI|nr:glycine-rich RNA-binding protein GRP2A [Brachypodium distachyon]KQK23125.1 hypothetical protein BRADI_1g71377v3 [Brachypodium distachyon]|eukprot:XP_003558590.1 glycine-rich RNA-binding protein GRP2A [Brachypodium distachyon]
MSAPWWDSDWKDRSGPEYRVHVGNLAWGTDERSLKDAFADHGPIGAEIVYDQEMDRSRGFGFVNFNDHKSMSDAIQRMNGQELDGRSITVNQANHRARKWRA